MVGGGRRGCDRVVCWASVWFEAWRITQLQRTDIYSTQKHIEGLVNACVWVWLCHGAHMCVLSCLPHAACLTTASCKPLTVGVSCQMPMIVACANLLHAVILLVFALNLFREGVAGGSPTGGGGGAECAVGVEWTCGWSARVFADPRQSTVCSFHMLHCEFCYTLARVLGIEATRLWE